MFINCLKNYEFWSIICYFLVFSPSTLSTLIKFLNYGLIGCWFVAASSSLVRTLLCYEIPFYCSANLYRSLFKNIFWCILGQNNKRKKREYTHHKKIRCTTVHIYVSLPNTVPIVPYIRVIILGVSLATSNVSIGVKYSRRDAKQTNVSFILSMQHF